MWDEAEEQIDQQREAYNRQQAPNVTRRNEALRRRDEGVTPHNAGVEKASPQSSPTPPSITPLKERKKTSPKGESKERTLSPALEQALKDFKDMRTRMRKPMTPLAVDLLIQRLAKMGDEATQVAILHQSIENGWTGVYELKTGMTGIDKSRRNNTLLNYKEQARIEEIHLDPSELDPAPPKKPTRAKKRDLFSLGDGTTSYVNLNDIALTLEDEL